MTMDSLTRRFTWEMLESWKVAETVAGASRCNRCGQCAARCPYSLAIPDQIQDGVRRYHEFARRHRPPAAT